MSNGKKLMALGAENAKLKKLRARPMIDLPMLMVMLGKHV